jgi:hypothetical protein
MGRSCISAMLNVGKCRCTTLIIDVKVSTCINRNTSIILLERQMRL